MVVIQFLQVIATIISSPIEIYIFSLCYHCMLLHDSTRSLSMVDVLVLYVIEYCFLLCTLANLCFRKTSIWNVRFLYEYFQSFHI